MPQWQHFSTKSSETMSQTFDIAALDAIIETPAAALENAVLRASQDSRTAFGDIEKLMGAIHVTNVYTVVDAILDRAKLELTAARLAWNNRVETGALQSTDTPIVAFSQHFVMLGVESEAHAMVQNMRTKLSNMRRSMEDRGLPIRRFRINKSDIRRVPNHPLTIFTLDYTENMDDNAMRASFHVHLILNKHDMEFLRPTVSPKKK